MVNNDKTYCRFDRCYFGITHEGGFGGMGRGAGGGAGAGAGGGGSAGKGWTFAGGALVTNTSALLDFDHPSDHYGVLVWVWMWVWGRDRHVCMCVCSLEWITTLKLTCVWE